MRPEDIGLSSTQILEEVVSNIEAFEAVHGPKLMRLQTAWDLYKGIPQSTNRRELDGFANTFVYETPRIVDALTATQMRMVWSSDPPFELRPQTPMITPSAAYKMEALVSKQMEWIKYKRNLFRTIKSRFLIGTAFIEQPLVSGPMVMGMPTWESAGFVQRPMNQVFFSPGAIDFDQADYSGTFDLVSNYRLKQMMEADPGQSAWLADGIQAAMMDNNERLPTAVLNRLHSGHLYDFKGIKELAIHYGTLKSDPYMREWVVGVINRRHFVRFHPTVIPGERPLRCSTFHWIEQEPYGWGIQNDELIQRMLNANRNRLFDLITFALYSMWKVDRFAGLDVREAKIRPQNFLMMDNIQGLERLSPDLNAANYGVRLDEILKEELRSRHATPQAIQAIPQDITATEVNAVTDSAQRIIGVDAELFDEEIVRPSINYMVKTNSVFVDRNIWLSTTGETGPVMITPEEAAHRFDVKTKLTTDKDFRPNRLRRLIEYLGTRTSFRNTFSRPINTDAIDEEIAKLFDLDPKRLLPPLPPQNNFGDMMMQNFQQQQARLGLINQERSLFGNPSQLQGSQETPLPNEI